MFNTREPVRWKALPYTTKLILNRMYWALHSYWKKKGYNIQCTKDDVMDLLEYHDLLDIKASALGTKFRIVPIDPTKPITRENIQIKTKYKGYGRNLNISQ